MKITNTGPLQNEAKKFYNSLRRLAAIQVTNLLPKNMHKYEGHVQKKNVKQCIYAN